MAATTTLLGLVTPTQGSLPGVWGDTVNYGISDYLDIAIAGTLSFAGDGAITLANTTGSSSGNSIGATTAQYAIIRVTGTLTTAKIITGPSYSKTYLVVNAATGSTVTFKASGQTGVSIAVGETALVYYNGTDYVKVVGTATAGAAGGSTTQVQYNNAGVLAGITGATSNGTALTLVAPVLGAATATSLQGIIGNVTPAAGAFTTLSASGKISSTSTGEFLLATTTTAANYARINSSGGDYYLGVSNSTGATLGSTAYAMVFQTASGRVIESMVNTAVITSVSSTGLAVTGTLSATGTLSGGTSGTAYSFSGSAPATSLTLDASGNLGIGTTTITSGAGWTPRLVLADATAPALIVRGANSQEGSVGVINGMVIDSLGNTTGTNNNIIFRNTSTNSSFTAIERMRLDSSGNLMVGTTVAVTGAKLSSISSGGDQAAAFKSDASTSVAILNLWGNEASGNQIFTRFATDSNAERGAITYNRAGGLVAYNVTSDYRAKDIYGPVTGSGALIDSVPVYMGKMKDATQERPMFIAHEVPAYAHTGEKDAVDKDGKPVYQQMDASALIPVMWAELQSLRARVAHLESKS